jgi:hypothetical protein
VASPSAYARPGDDVAPNATWSVTSGAAATGYPASQVGNRNPAKPFKATGTSATIRATFGSAQVLVGVALINHNLAGAASVVITSGAGLNQVIPVAANAGGQCTHAILDFSAASSGQRTSTTFDIAVTTGVLGNVAIGEVLLLTAIRDLSWLWGLTVRIKRLVRRAGTTFGATDLQYNKRVRIRVIAAKTDAQTVEAEMRTLEEEAQGEVFPWLIWYDRTVNEAFYVKFQPGAFSWTPQSTGFTDIPIEAEELSSGPPLFP